MHFVSTVGAMGRRLLAVLPLLLAVPARADVLPPDQEAIARDVQLLDTQRFETLVFVLAPCTPPGAPELDYCVLRDEAARPLSGRLFGLRKRGTRTKEVGVDGGEAALRITTPVPAGLDHAAFFAKDPRVIRSNGDVGASTRVVVPKSAALASVTEVQRVVSASGDGIVVEPVKVIWNCRNGQRIVRAPAPPADAGDDANVPACAPTPERISAEPAPVQPVAPRALPVWERVPRPALLAAAASLVVLGGALWLWRRRK